MGLNLRNDQKFPFQRILDGPIGSLTETFISVPGPVIGDKRRTRVGAGIDKLLFAGGTGESESDKGGIRNLAVFILTLRACPKCYLEALPTVETEEVVLL